LLFFKIRTLTVYDKPSLPAFNGFVPSGTKGSRALLKYWSGFSAQDSSVPRLPPKSNLFPIIARRYAEIQLEEYAPYLTSAKSVYFSSDTFNENPVSADDDFVQLAEGIYSPLKRAADKWGFNVKIVMQMWFFANDFYFWTQSKAKELLVAFPKNSLILLDLHAEKRPQFERLRLASAPWFRVSGHTIIFCVLHNFGGGGGIAGEVSKTWSDVLKLKNLQIDGVGFAPEAIEQNEIVYDFLLHSAWSLETLDTINWVSSRYRQPLIGGMFVHRAWKLALDTAYSRPPRLSGFGPTKSVWEIRPFPGDLRRNLFMPTLIHYPAETFLRCLKDFLHSFTALSGSLAYQHDIVDFSRQLISDLALFLSSRLERMYLDDDQKQANKTSLELRQLLDVCGALLSSHADFCFQ
jgi:alpha-N-acetylglucosaminidase